MVSNLQEPTELFNRLQQDFNSLFKSSAEKSSPAANDQSNTVTGLWVPPINIHEADSQFFVSVNIPGINISPRTVEIHRARAMEKMQAKTLAQLVQMVVETQHQDSV